MALPRAHPNPDLIEVIGEILAPCRDVNGCFPLRPNDRVRPGAVGVPAAPFEAAWRRFLDAYETHYDAETRSRFLDGEDRERAHYAAMREGLAAAIEGET